MEPDYTYGILPMMAPKDGRPFYGRQYFEVTPILEWALVYAELFKSHQGSGPKPLVVNFGDTTGWEAMQFAQKGCDAVAIDFIGGQGEEEKQDVKEIVAERNRRLAQNPENGKIDLVVRDIREMGSKELREICGRRNPPIMTAFDLIHYFNDSETTNFLDLTLSLKPEVLALSFHTIENPENTINHDADKIEGILNAKGYDTEHRKIEKMPKYDASAKETRLGFSRNPQGIGHPHL
jgi:hypothetical protein